MKEGWEIRKLGDTIQDVVYTTKVKSSDYKKIGLFPVISQEQQLISGYWDNPDDVYKVNKPIVVFGDHTKEVKYIDFDFVLGADGVKILLPINEIDSKYFFYYIKSLKISSLGYARHYRLLKEKNVAYPKSISEQQRIVSKLDSAFEKIDALKANAENNLKNAKDLFQQVLKKELEPKEGWCMSNIENVCSNIVDCPHSTPKKSEVPTEYPCIRTSELKRGEIYWDSMQYLDKNEYEKRVLRLTPESDDIVYGREGTFGDAVMLPSGYKFSLGQRTMLLRPNKKIILPKFMLYAVISPFIFNQAKAKNFGCGVGHVNVGDIKLFKISFPSLSEQQRIVSILDSLSDKCKRLEENYRKTAVECDALKQAVLREVINDK